MTRTMIIRTFALTSAAMLAPVALAGSPGQMTDVTSEAVDIRTTLSPAELRNAITVQLDTLAAQGIEIDRSAYDGVGLEWAATGESIEFFTEARLLAPRLENRSP